MVFSLSKYTKRCVTETNACHLYSTNLKAKCWLFYHFITEMPGLDNSIKLQLIEIKKTF